MNLVIYNGRSYYREDTETAVILTSLDKTNGRTTILEFTKDEQLSNQTLESVKRMIRDSIIKQYYKEKLEKEQNK